MRVLELPFRVMLKLSCSGPQFLWTLRKYEASRYQQNVKPIVSTCSLSPRTNPKPQTAYHHRVLVTLRCFSSGSTLLSSRAINKAGIRLGPSRALSRFTHITPRVETVYERHYYY